MPSIAELEGPAEAQRVMDVRYRARIRASNYQRLQEMLHSNGFQRSGFAFMKLATLPEDVFRKETRSLIIERKYDIQTVGYLSVTAKGKTK